MKFKGDNLPAEGITWDNCQEFIKRLNSLTGLRFRLPTEAEWEFAARGGNKSRGYKYSGSNDPLEVGWCEENSNQQLHPVGLKKSNELGLYDMSGNAWEWTSDIYCEDYNSQRNHKYGYVGRSSSWNYPARAMRVAARGSTPMDRGGSMGFRLVLSI